MHRTRVYGRTHAREGRTIQCNTTQKSRMHSSGFRLLECAIQPTYMYVRCPTYSADPTDVSRKYRKRNVSLFSDWFCERHARASLTLTPGTAWEREKSALTLRKGVSPGGSPSRISDLISDLRVSILSGDWEIHFRDVPTCNASLFF